MAPRFWFSCLICGNFHWPIAMAINKSLECCNKISQVNRDEIPSRGKSKYNKAVNVCPVESLQSSHVLLLWASFDQNAYLWWEWFYRSWDATAIRSDSTSCTLLQWREINSHTNTNAPHTQSRKRAHVEKLKAIENRFTDKCSTTLKNKTFSIAVPQNS